MKVLYTTYARNSGDIGSVILPRFDGDTKLDRILEHNQITSNDITEVERTVKSDCSTEDQNFRITIKKCEEV